MRDSSPGGTILSFSASDYSVQSYATKMSRAVPDSLSLFPSPYARTGRRSSGLMRRAMPHSPELDDFAVTRTDAGYSYSLPRALVGKVEHTPVALRELVGELRPLLVELTGQVVVRRIQQIPELQERGILSPSYRSVNANQPVLEHLATGERRAESHPRMRAPQPQCFPW